jgi:hypothetical protein
MGNVSKPIAETVKEITGLEVENYECFHVCGRNTHKKERTIYAYHVH